MYVCVYDCYFIQFFYFLQIIACCDHLVNKVISCYMIISFLTNYFYNNNWDVDCNQTISSDDNDVHYFKVRMQLSNQLTFNFII